MSAQRQWRRVGKDDEFEGEAEAVRLSLDEDRGRQRKLAILKGRLAERHLVLKPVEPDGNCQFHALVEVLPDLRYTHVQLRKMAVDYLRKQAGDFVEFLETGPQARFRGFHQYLQYIAQPKKWGDNLTLAALANVLMRPIVVINDALADLGSETTLFPIHVAKRLWKKPVTLAHHLELHYDAVVKQDRALAPVFDSGVVLSCEYCREFGRANCRFHADH